VDRLRCKQKEADKQLAPCSQDSSVSNLPLKSSQQSTYHDANEDLATSLFGKKKKKLTKSPFIRKLEIGIIKEGYWKYMHMCIQLEDCIDCIQYVCKNRGWNFDISFELDHSSSHTHSQPNRLSLTDLRLGWGGKQKPM
jgi:hypothetical protein